jgi:hypothetical protein
MTASHADFRAFYELDKIVVTGTVTESDGSTTLVRIQPQGINSKILLLKLQVEPYPGQFHPRIAIQKQVRYEETAGPGAFSEVHIQAANGSFTLNVE